MTHTIGMSLIERGNHKQLSLTHKFPNTFPVASVLPSCWPLLCFTWPRPLSPSSVSLYSRRRCAGSTQPPTTIDTSALSLPDTLSLGPLSFSQILCSPLFLPAHGNIGPPAVAAAPKRFPPSPNSSSEHPSLWAALKNSTSDNCSVPSPLLCGTPGSAAAGHQWLVAHQPRRRLTRRPLPLPSGTITTSVLFLASLVICVGRWKPKFPFNEFYLLIAKFWWIMWCVIGHKELLGCESRMNQELMLELN